MTDLDDSPSPAVELQKQTPPAELQKKPLSANSQTADKISQSQEQRASSNESSFLSALAPIFSSCPWFKTATKNVQPVRSSASARNALDPRGHWRGRFDLVAALIGATLGLANISQFPVLVWNYGVSTILLPYIFVLVFVGVPVFYLEACLGQFSGHGAVLGWHMAPLFKGVGVSIGLTSFLMSICYAVMNIYPLFYFWSSFNFPLPWSDCNNVWNSEKCVTIIDCEGPKQERNANGSCYSDEKKFLGFWNVTGHTAEDSLYSSEEFWIENMGYPAKRVEKWAGLQGDLVGCLFVVWMICFFSLWRDLSHLVKIMLFNALVMFVVLIVFIINGFTLEGYVLGANYFLEPRSENVLLSEAWLKACSQAFFDVTLGMGVISTITSYSRFSDGDPFRIAIIIVCLDSFVCVIASVSFFLYAGHMAYRLQKSSENFTVDNSHYLIYVVYPESIGQMKVGPILSIIFFWALLGLGISSELAFIQVLLTMVLDRFPNLIRKRVAVVAIICLVGFLLCLPFTAKQGFYWAQVISDDIFSLCLLMNALMEVIVTTWVYGLKNFCCDIKMMIGKEVSNYFKACWIVIIPCFLMVLIFRNLVDRIIYVREGLILAFLPMFAVLATMIYQLRQRPSEESWSQRIKELLKPDSEWTRSQRFRPTSHTQISSHISLVEEDRKSVSFIDYHQLDNVESTSTLLKDPGRFSAVMDIGKESSVLDFGTSTADSVEQRWKQQNLKIEEEREEQLEEWEHSPNLPGTVPQDK